MLSADDPEVVGEAIHVAERLIVSTAHGRFHPDLAYGPGARPVRCGQAVGTVGDVEVVSSFDGYLMGFLVLPGERVQRSQAVAWLRPGVDRALGVGAAEDGRRRGRALGTRLGRIRRRRRHPRRRRR